METEVVSLPLTELPPGHPARVVHVPPDDGHRLLRLAALGLVNGARVRLLQREPAALVQVGGTTLAIETEIARHISVVIEAE